RTAAALHELLAHVLRPERATAAPDLALPRRPPARALGRRRRPYGPRARGQAGSGERRPARRGPRAAPGSALRPSRRQLFQLAAAGAAPPAPPASARAFGESALFDMPLLRYAEDGWNPRPNAIRRALLEIEMTTSIRVATTPGTVRPTLDDLLGTPFAVL